jgi:putative protease
MIADAEKRVELLAPAGNWDCARAAVAQGADAIYFGMPQFNARLRADNFTLEDLPRLMDFLHANQVRGFVAFNTLIFPRELEAAEEQLARLQEAGVDAVIVQDLGLASWVHRIAPQVALHASTQMTISSPEGLEFASQLGLQRAVLSRELSLRELERFRGSSVPLEVFVHGALCVAYSGQCLTSESLGQRSANRGECAQACRMPYQLVVDGVLRDLGDKKYLLSPQDLAAVAEIPRLVALGIKSYKIEGRLKSPEYVAAVTRVYRRALDAALVGQEAHMTAAEHYSLEMTFSRGLFTGWLHGVDHQKLVGARYGKKRGAFLGNVVGLTREGVELDRLHTPLKPGDGVVFDTGEDTNAEQGGFVFEVRHCELRFARGKIRWERVPVGAKVWKTCDPALDKELRRSFQSISAEAARAPLHFRVRGSAGVPLQLEITLTSGAKHHFTSDQVLQVAQKHALSDAVLREQLGRLGGTRFTLASLENALEGSVMLPLSAFGKLRKKFTSELPVETAVTPPKAQRGLLRAALAELRSEREKPKIDQPAELAILCRTEAQMRQAAIFGIPRLYLDFEDIRLFGPAVAWCRAEAPSVEVFLATPRIQKSGEQGFFKLIERAEPHGVLVRNLGAIPHFKALKMTMAGDFSLNVANPLAAQFFMQQGLERLTISYDLNVEQALDLLHAAPPQWFELTLHQHMPMFHMEHCVFAAFMSQGSTFLDCGRPCEKHTVHLRDRVGMEHPLKADVGCRNTLFNAVPQTAAHFYADLHATGLRAYRIELLTETAEDTQKLLTAYQSLLRGFSDGRELWRTLKARSQYGVTGGTLR